jgi:hypothetical protein
MLMPIVSLKPHLVVPARIPRTFERARIWCDPKKIVGYISYVYLTVEMIFSQVIPALVTPGIVTSSRCVVLQQDRFLVTNIRGYYFFPLILKSVLASARSSDQRISRRRITTATAILSAYLVSGAIKPDSFRCIFSCTEIPRLHLLLVGYTISLHPGVEESSSSIVRPVLDFELEARDNILPI